MESTKEIVTLIMIVRLAFYVDQTIVQISLDFILKLIAVINQLLEMNIFVQKLIPVQYMKEIVIQIMNVKKNFSVTLLHLIAAQKVLDLHLMWIAVPLEVSFLK